MKPVALAFTLLSGLGASCPLRLPLRQVPCTSGLWVETETRG
jgi:hypothetical protein